MLGPAAESSLTASHMHATVKGKPSSLVSQKEEEETVTLPLAGVHVVMGGGRAAPRGSGEPRKGWSSASTLNHKGTGTALKTSFCLLFT